MSIGYKMYFGLAFSIIIGMFGWMIYMNLDPNIEVGKCYKYHSKDPFNQKDYIIKIDAKLGEYVQYHSEGYTKISNYISGMRNFYLVDCGKEK